MNFIHCSFRNTDFYLLNMELKLTMIHSQKLGGGGRLRYRASYRSIDKSVFYVFTCTVYILLQTRPTAFYCNYGSFITRDFGMITVANFNAKRMDSKNCHISPRIKSVSEDCMYMCISRKSKSYQPFVLS